MLEGLNCWSRAVHKRWYNDLFGWAVWFYGGTDFPVVQCLWPAEDGTYPWQETSAFFSVQPLLYEDSLIAARMLHYADEQEVTKTEWPFTEDPHHSVYVSRCVVEDKAPIVLVLHESNGDWQFIGPLDDPDADGCKISCFRCVVERDPSIRALGRLPPGGEATRHRAGEWTILRPERG